MAHVVDDFLLMAHSEAKCLDDLKLFVDLCSELGVPLAPSKTVAPCHVLAFIGITIDAVRN